MADSAKAKQKKANKQGAGKQKNVASAKSTSKPSSNKGSLDLLKWLVVMALVAGGIWANSYYSEQSVLYRVLGLCVVAVVAGYIAYLTTRGRAFWELVQGARTEVRRVVWPTQQETTTTTLVVVGVTVLMGLILWGLDSFFGYLVSMVIG